MNHSWSYADGKPAGQNGGDQSSLKETAIDCGLLVDLNKLPRARLGHYLMLPEVGPEREDSSKH